MSNLGAYQTITTVSKKVGGPKIFIGGLLFIGGGVALGIENGIKYVCKKFRKKKSEVKVDSFTVKKDGVSNEGVKFIRGDKLQILEKDGNVLLVSREGDDNSPYYISEKFYNEIN